MSNPNPEVLIIPGSFALPPPYQPLVSAFISAGYPSRIVPLLSANDGTVFPAATMSDDASHIRSQILSTLDHPTSPRSVILAAHSYAGFPASEALRGLDPSSRRASGKSTSVIALVAIASFLPQEGDCLRSVMPSIEDSPAAEKPVPRGYLSWIPAEFAEYLFNDIDDVEERLRLHATMGRHSSDSYDGKVGYAAWRDVPTLMIIPGQDLIVPVEIQEGMFEKAKGGRRVERRVYEGAGHCYLWAKGGVERTVGDVIAFVDGGK